MFFKILLDFLSLVPITTLSGYVKSLMASPSLRNSGFIPNETTIALLVLLISSKIALALIATPFCCDMALTVATVLSKTPSVSSLCIRANKDNFPACTLANPICLFKAVNVIKVSPPKSANNPVWAVNSVNALFNSVLFTNNLPDCTADMANSFWNFLASDD